MPIDKRERLNTIMQHIDAASDQVMKAARTGNIHDVKAVLIYWFGMMYDEGSSRINDLEMAIETLQKQYERVKGLRRSLAQQMVVYRRGKKTDE